MMRAISAEMRMEARSETFDDLWGIGERIRMTQAAVDSPAQTPGQNPASDAPNTDASALASADDLLAQLAGEEIDRLLAEDDADSAKPLAPVVPAEMPPAPPSEAAQLNEVLRAAEKPAASVESPAPAAAPAKEISPEVAEAADLNSATAAAEMKQLLDDKVIPEQSSETVPLYVRVLEVLNSPLASMSDSARELIGKLAILTLFNSVAVLLYVLIFRKH